MRRTRARSVVVLVVAGAATAAAVLVYCLWVVPRAGFVEFPPFV